MSRFLIRVDGMDNALRPVNFARDTPAPHTALGIRLLNVQDK